MAIPKSSAEFATTDLGVPSHSILLTKTSPLACSSKSIAKSLLTSTGATIIARAPTREIEITEVIEETEKIEDRTDRFSAPPPTKTFAKKSGQEGKELKTEGGRYRYICTLDNPDFLKTVETIGIELENNPASIFNNPIDRAVIQKLAHQVKILDSFNLLKVKVEKKRYITIENFEFRTPTNCPIMTKIDKILRSMYDATEKITKTFISKKTFFLQQNLQDDEVVETIGYLSLIARWQSTLSGSNQKSKIDQIIKETKKRQQSNLRKETLTEKKCEAFAKQLCPFNSRNASKEKFHALSQAAKKSACYLVDFSKRKTTNLSKFVKQKAGFGQNSSWLFSKKPLLQKSFPFVKFSSKEKTKPGNFELSMRVFDKISKIRSEALEKHYSENLQENTDFTYHAAILQDGAYSPEEASEISQQARTLIHKWALNENEHLSSITNVVKLFRFLDKEIPEKTEDIFLSTTVQRNSNELTFRTDGNEALYTQFIDLKKPLSFSITDSKEELVPHTTLEEKLDNPLPPDIQMMTTLEKVLENEGKIEIDEDATTPCVLVTTSAENLVPVLPISFSDRTELLKNR